MMARTAKRAAAAPQGTAVAEVPEVAHTVVDSPIGPLTLARRGSAITGVWMQDHRPAPNPATLGEASDTGFDEAKRQFDEYFAGERRTFELELASEGTEFQREVWRVLSEIPYGETRTYAWLAERIGRPTAFRAVGLANGRNPISIIVPCHRVVGASGALTGYGGGIERKAALLALERGIAGWLAETPLGAKVGT